MREIKASDVTATIKRLCQEANLELGEDMLRAFDRALTTERSPAGRQVLEMIKENARIARTDRLPYCQDTGFLICFVELGQDVHVTGGLLHDALDEGARPPAGGPPGGRGWTPGAPRAAGPAASPPLIAGVGIGGTFEKAAILSKKALFRELGSPNPDPTVDALEKDLLDRANRLGIGPQGYGGDTPAPGIHI